MKQYITTELYNAIIKAKENKEYINHITNTKCGLGKIKTFIVKGTSIEVKMKCTQIGGMFTGSHCFIPV